jgi:hypothetical protein
MLKIGVGIRKVRGVAFGGGRVENKTYVKCGGVRIG